VAVYANDTITLIEGDCVEALRIMPDACVDAIVTDPPYGLEFMGKDWDSFRNDNPNYLRPPGTKGSNNTYGPRFGVRQHGDKIGVAKVVARSVAYGTWCTEWAIECHRVLKPGGHILAMGGTRTFHRLTCAIEDAGFEIRDCVSWLYGSGFPKSMDVSKAIDKLAGAERASKNGQGDHEGTVDFGMKNRCPNCDKPYFSGNPCTCPRADKVAITPEAEQWNGWGTALKPAHEPVIIARKPYGQDDILSQIGSQLDALESAWRVQEAAPTTPTGEVGGSSDLMAMSPSVSMADMFLNTVMSWRRCLVEICELTSMSITATRSSTTTDLKTLSSCLSQITPANITPDLTNLDGLKSIVSIVDNLFAAVVLSTRATHGLSAAGSVTDKVPLLSQDEVAKPIAWEPIIVARKPLTGTVAQNVLTHGTGALNIDATRIPCEVNPSIARRNGAVNHLSTRPASEAEAEGKMESRTSVERFREVHPGEAQGRWPTNVVLDENAASALDADTKPTKSTGGKTSKTTFKNVYGEYANEKPCGEYANAGGLGDEGGVSRYFPVINTRDGEPTAEKRYTTEGGTNFAMKPGERRPQAEGPSEFFPVFKDDEPVRRVRSRPPSSDLGVMNDDGWQPKTVDQVSYTDDGGPSRFFPIFKYQAKAPKSERPKVAGVSAHPTVKPLALFKWLVRLVTPPGGIVLDPFAGSGTTGQAAIEEGMNAILIEREPDYIKLILSRLGMAGEQAS